MIKYHHCILYGRVHCVKQKVDTHCITTRHAGLHLQITIICAKYILLCGFIFHWMCGLLQLFSDNLHWGKQKSWRIGGSSHNEDLNLSIQQVPNFFLYATFIAKVSLHFHTNPWRPEIAFNKRTVNEEGLSHVSSVSKAF